jgi:hypothetical protein
MCKPIGMLCDSTDKISPSGQCRVDLNISQSTTEEAAIIATERAKVPKLQIVFGNWWPYYAPPGEFTYTLYRARDFCPYCGGSLGPLYVPKAESSEPFKGRAHLDHMDPLAHGGEDSIRNTLYVCDDCNMAKRFRPFVEWLDFLKPDYQALAHQLYTEKHGSTPESFIRSIKLTRSAGRLAELLLDESVLRHLYPRPIVTGPPRRSSDTRRAS